MSVNGVSNYSKVDAYSSYAKQAQDVSEKAASDKPKKEEESGVIYEKSEEAAKSTKYKPNAELIEKLKADMEAQKQSLLSMVQETISGQGNALAASDDIWRYLASGNFTVTEAAKKQAQDSIAEGGYWSVEKTSDRIIEMAKALTGGDPSKIEDMRSAFEKGFKEATKTWGKDLPGISNDTYDAVQKKFDKWAEEANTTAGVQ